MQVWQVDSGESNSGESFLGLQQRDVERIFGLETYLNGHGDVGSAVSRLHRDSPQLIDWRMTIPFHRKTILILYVVPEISSVVQLVCKLNRHAARNVRHMCALIVGVLCTIASQTCQRQRHLTT